MTKLICIYWRDIPAQVIGRIGRKTVIKQELSPRFAKAIDRAAMRAGRGSSDAYLEDWRRDTIEVSGEIKQLLAEKVSEFEEQYNDSHLKSLIKAGGTFEKGKT